MERIYNLTGGILSWNDHAVPEFPKIAAFPLHGRPKDILYQAMDMERGTFFFYSQVLVRHKEQEFAHFIDLLARAEEGHARLIYRYYKQEYAQAEPFEILYDSLPGEVLEGGQSRQELRQFLDKKSDDPCLDIIEMAISIEYAAYDLYRNMADYFSGAPMEEAFLSIAQAEKEHMRIAAEALILCRA